MAHGKRTVDQIGAHVVSYGRVPMGAYPGHYNIQLELSRAQHPQRIMALNIAQSGNDNSLFPPILLFDKNITPKNLSAAIKILMPV